MKTTLHLVSLPMVFPLQPSGPLGCLHAFAAAQFTDGTPVHSYSAFLDVLFEFKGAEFVQFYLDYRFHAEELFFLVCSRSDPPPGSDVADLLEAFNRSVGPQLALTPHDILGLEQALARWVDRRLVPALDPAALNVIGFTTTFAQLFASIFVARRLRQDHVDIPTLLVFGGASVALPEAARTLDLWGVDGLIISGPGEGPLRLMLDACRTADGPFAATAAILREAAPQIRSIGGPRRATPAPDLGAGGLDWLPLPDYDEYFSVLRRICADEETFQRLVQQDVALPLEGSRGCFAKCDFCQVPALTTRFRSRNGPTVAERASELCRRYGKDEVVFADAVCNTWAEEYADALLAEGRTITAFMEMRVHRPEGFWTKLALCGVTEMQLGIEALSEPLLKAMNKGTTVIQNLKAAKHLAELRVRSLSNLITFHPKSTPADIAETRRVLAATPHFPPLALSPFSLSFGSPLHDALDEGARAQLQGGFPWLEAALRPWSTNKDLAYPYPETWLDPEVLEGWREFHLWCDLSFVSRPSFTVETTARGLRLEDGRSGAPKLIWLEGERARLYDVLHRGPTLEIAARRLDLSLRRVEQLTDDLEDQGLVLRTGRHVLSLAIRSRAELIANLHRLEPVAEMTA